MPVWRPTRVGSAPSALGGPRYRREDPGWAEVCANFVTIPPHPSGWDRSTRPKWTGRPPGASQLSPASRAPSTATDASSASRACRSPSRSTRSSTTPIVNARRVEVGLDLVPRERRRHRRAGTRAHRVRRRDRLALAVLVRVDQHPSASRLRPLRRRELRVRADDRRRHELGERPRVVVGRAPVERDEDVDALAAATSSGTTRDRASRAPRLHEQRHLRSSAATAPPASGRGRRARSRAGRAVDPRVPRVHVDAAHVRHPEQRELVVHERERDLAFACSARAARRARDTSGSSRACATARPSGRTPCRRCRRDSGAS